MKQLCSPLLLVLAAALLFPACSTGGKRLNDTERAYLKDASAIHVFHYDTALPQIRSADKKAPTPAAVRKVLAADPAAQIAGQFARVLARQERLRNVQTPRPLTRPVSTNPREFRDKLRDGLVLELWVDDWQFSPVPAEPKNHVMTLTTHARLTRLTDGKLLWRAEGCRLANGARSVKLAAADLTQPVRLRKALTAARDECAQQLLRDFTRRPER
jgi:hypothetical protein